MAKKEQDWTVFIGEAAHTVSFTSPGFFGRGRLYVDGYEEKLNRDMQAQYIGVDIPILTEYADNIRFVYTKNKADVAVDGVFLTSGLPYEPLEKLTPIGWVFVILCWLPMVFVGSLVGGLICGAFSSLCILVLVNRNFSNKKRKLLGAGLSLACIAICVGVFVLFIEYNKQPKKFTSGSYSITLDNSFALVDEDELKIEDADVVFGATSDDVIAICLLDDANPPALGQLYFDDVADYLSFIADINEVDAEVAATVNNTYYITFFDYVDGENTFYIISAVFENDAYWLTQLYCNANLADKYEPRMLEWIDTITITN